MRNEIISFTLAELTNLGHGNVSVKFDVGFENGTNLVESSKEIQRVIDCVFDSRLRDQLGYNEQVDPHLANNMNIPPQYAPMSQQHGYPYPYPQQPYQQHNNIAPGINYNKGAQTSIELMSDRLDTMERKVHYIDTTHSSLIKTSDAKIQEMQGLIENLTKELEVLSEYVARVNPPQETPEDVFKEETDTTKKDD